METRRHLILAFALWLIPQIAGAALTETNLPSGSPDDWKLTGPAAGDSKLVAASQKFQGALPLEINYAFKKDQNDFIFLEKKVPLPGVPKKAKLNLYGDNSGVTVRMNFVDASGEIFQAAAAKVNWEGWKEIETDLVFPVHWGGDNNGQMDGEVSFHSLVVNSEKDETKNKGAIGFNGLKIFSENVQAAQAAPVGMERSVRVTIDDFERPNPLTVYQTWRGDDSSIDALSATEFKKEGNYSMQITYQLSTARSVPSWVSVSFSPDRPMDWTGVEELKLWLKGDGSRNIFQISLVDDQNKIWTFKIEGALKNVDWQLLTIPVFNFKDVERKERLEPGRIKKYEFAVVGEESQITSGRIWLDEFVVTGKDLNPLVASPRPPVAPEVIEKTKINFGDLIHLEYRQTPEFNDQFLFFNSLFVRGTSKKISLAADLVSLQKEAGQTVGFRAPQEASAGQVAAPIDVVEDRTPIQLAYINASIHDVHPNLTEIAVGNLLIDYGRNAFAPVIGFKGIQGEGSYAIVPGTDTLHYDAFAIKHAFDSVTFGSRVQLFYDQVLARFIMVHHRDTARSIANAVVQNNQLVIPTNVEVKTDPIGSDSLYLFEADRNFFDGALNLNGTYGLDFFDREAVKDVKDPFNPVVKSQLETPESLFGRMWEIKLKTSGVLNKGFTFLTSYRDFGTDFKPRFRFSPTFYDDFFADQRGFKFELTQIVGKAKFVGQYDDVVRGPSNNGYFRRFFQGSLGYYGLNKMDIVFSYNQRKEFYALGENHLRSAFFINPNDPRNEEEKAYEIFLGNWFSTTFYIWTKLRMQNLTLFNSGRKLRTDAMQIQGEYAVTSNAKILLTIIQTRFDDKSSVPFGGDPPTDNVVRLYLDVNF